MILEVMSRPSTEAERRAGHGSLTKSFIAAHDLDNREGVRRAWERLRKGEGGITPAHVIMLDAGRPVSRDVLKALFSQEELEGSVVEEASDPEAIDLIKSERAAEGDEMYEPAWIITEEFVSKSERAERGLGHHDAWIKSAQQVLVPTTVSIPERLMKALMARDPRVRDTDLALWDAKRAVRAPAFEAILQEGESLEEVGFGETLAKSRAAMASFLDEHADAMRTAGFEIDTEASALTGKLIARSVKCTDRSAQDCKIEYREVPR